MRHTLYAARARRARPGPGRHGAWPEPRRTVSPEAQSRSELDSVHFGPGVKLASGDSTRRSHDKFKLRQCLRRREPWQVDPARHCNPAGGRGRRPILRRCRGRGRRQLGGRGPGSASESIMMAGWPRRTRTHSELESPLASRWTRRLAAALRPGGPTGGPAKPSSTSSVKPGSGSICR